MSAFCQTNILAYSDLESKEIGILDLINYLKDLVSKGSSESKIASDFNLDAFKNLSESQLKSKIGSLKSLFEKRNKDLSTKRQKLIDVQIINDGELQHYENQLVEMKKILSNTDFNNSIKVIQNKQNLGYELTEGDKTIYSFYKELQEQVRYLENFKIGNHSDFVKRAKKHNDNKKQHKSAINNLMKGVEMNDVLSVWADNTTKSIIEKLDGDFTKNMNNSKINLRAKVIKSLMNFLNIDARRASVIMSDKMFREKMFKNVNLEDVQNKLNIVNKELNEHSIVLEYLNVEEREKQQSRIIQFAKIENDSTERNPGFEMTSAGQIDGAIPQKIKMLGEMARKLSIKENLERSLKSSYKVLLNNKLVNDSEYKQIEKVIDIELKQLETYESDIELFGESASIQSIKDTIKVHVARILLEKNNLDKNAFEPLNNTTSLLSKLFGDKLDTIITYENLFNNIINYDTTEPVSAMKKSFNNMINFLIELKTEEQTVKRISNLLYKEHGSSVYVLPLKKDLKKIIKKTQIFDELNVSNLLLLVSYIGNGSDFTASLLEEVAKKVELKENKTEDKPWTWATQSNKKDVISAVLNMTDGDYDFKAILGEFIGDDESKMEELKMIVRNIEMKDLKSILKQFNTLYDMFFRMSVMKVVPHNLNKMKLNKSFEDKQRTYFLGLLTGIYARFTEELLNKSDSKKVKEFVAKNISLLGMTLNKTSTFLQKPVEKRSAPAIVSEEPKESNKDALLNDFMVEDLDDLYLEDNEIIVEQGDLEDIVNIEELDDGRIAYEDLTAENLNTTVDWEATLLQEGTLLKEGSLV